MDQARATAASFESVDPATGEVLATLPVSSEADVDAAVSAAREAQPAWAAVDPTRRTRLLIRLAELVDEHAAELAELESRDVGKPIAESSTRDVKFTAQTWLYYSGWPSKILGTTNPANAGVFTYTLREPVGVVGIITPWNFPIAIPAWKIAPALAYGNCVVFKPADLVPGCAWALAEIIARAGVPAGVFNLVMGRGSVVGELLSNSIDIDAISFTGSAAVGRRVAQNCAARLAKVQLEMGGKNPQVVLDDADLDTAVNVSLQSAFFSTGQRCTAASRLIVTQGIHDRFVSALTAKMKTLKVDDALKDGTDIGPVVDKQQLEQDLRYIELGRKEGAKLAAGGERLKRGAEGYYLEPALFVDTTSQMTINRDEIFGPVASVIRVKDYDEALAVANDTPYGLSSGIATTSLKYAEHFKRNSAAGMVMVNLPTAGVDYHVPFGGRKGSSYGPREQGRYAVEFYTTVKTAYVNA
ncbi:MAG: aldehyde dehydrogenase family protein [Burkholderiales bacterium]